MPSQEGAKQVSAGACELSAGPRGLGLKTLHTRGADEASWERDASGRDIPFTHFTNDVDTSSCSAGALCGNLVESSISSLAAHFFCICCCLVSSEEGVGQDRVRADAAEMRNHVRMGLVKVEQMLDKV